MREPFDDVLETLAGNPGDEGEYEGLMRNRGFDPALWRYRLSPDSALRRKSLRSAWLQIWSICTVCVIDCGKEFEVCPGSR